MINFLQKIFRRKPKIIKANNLRDVIEYLLMDDEFVKVIEESESYVDLIDYGMWIRNNFGLWIHDTPLRNFFLQRQIWHPDDMSGIIIKTVYNYYKNIPIDFDTECKRYFDHWKKYLLDKKDISETLSDVEYLVYLTNLTSKDKKEWL